MTYLAASIVVIASLVGVLLTVLTLPGIWLALLAAVLCQWWRGDLFSWWTLGAVFALALLGEVVDVVASAAGAARAGASARGAIGSIIGAVVGAILGSPFFFPLGTVVGGAAGAGLGAVIAERHDGRRTWRDSARIGTGAAAGRLVATIAKAGIAVVVAVILSVAAFV